MADENKPADDVKFDDDGNEIKPDNADENAIGDDAENKDPENTDTGDDKEDEDKADDTGDDSEEVVPPTRGSVAQHIIARKNKTIEKLRSKNAEGEEDDDDDPDEKEQDKVSVENIVDAKLKPLTDIVGKNLDEGELKQLFIDEPDAKKYDKRIRIYMAHPEYKGVSPEVIFHHLAFKNAQALGAKKKKIADTEAELNKSGGRGLKPDKTGVKGAPTIEEMDNMSDAELEKMTDDALQGKFVE